MAKLLTHPGLFQQRLWPVAEHRVTVVGSEIFVATIEGCDPPDWRRQLPAAAEFRATTLPPNIVEAAVSTVAELGLQYAAVDLLEAEEAMYFLEVNPSGAWSWLERRLRLPITAAVCDLLCGVT
jgi:glutathione synthase/RimK-type ligase-like ATP-grasp enzyme